ncbi:MAG TPA: hypothetical protein VM344_05030, partial [Vitreimonas sp.]|nr:hypothetical protein [Vitreimonas sp.]
TEIDRRSPSGSLRRREGLGVRRLAETAPPPQAAGSTDLPAEAGIEASAPDLRALFEEAAAQLLRTSSRPEAAGPAWRWESISLRAADVSGLAGLWLDRLIELGESRLSDARREGVVIVVVDRVAPPEDDPQYGRWQLRARVGLRPYLETASALRRDPRSASDRPLAVEGVAGSWTLRASLAF